MTEAIVVTPMRLEARAPCGRRTARRAVVTSAHGRWTAGAAPLRRAASPRPAHAGRHRRVRRRADPGLRPGDLVVATEVRVADGAPAGLPLPAGRAARRPSCGGPGSTWSRGPIVSSRSVVRGADRAGASAPTGALAVDMESALAGRSARASDPPRVAVVRVLVDTPGHELFDPGTLRRVARACGRCARVAPGARARGRRRSAPREVLLAEPRSFCAGVERAIEIVERALERTARRCTCAGRSCTTPTSSTTSSAAARCSCDELDEVPDGRRAVLAAHGVAAAVRAEAGRRDLPVIDATCPLVAKVHAEVRRFAATPATRSCSSATTTTRRS